MPQVYMVIAPRAREAFDGDLGETNLRILGQILIDLTEEAYGLKGEDDVTFTAVQAACVVNDADVQIEVRYTVGEDEYNRGEPFEPSKEQMKLLADSIMDSLKEYLDKIVSSISVWVIPFRGTIFRYEEIE